MASWLAGTEIITKISNNLLEPKHNHYDLQYITLKLKAIPSLIVSNYMPKNRYQQRLSLSVFEYETDQQLAKYAIIYLHGYGSNKLQALSILNHLPKNYLLACFDFSGSGKSDGKISTYGLKQYEDITCIKNFISTKYNIRKFILWGRSMGASASLLHTSRNTGIAFQVIDSPFCSFETIAKQWGKQMLKIPQIFVGFGIEALKKKYKSQQYNPFLINLQQQVKNCHTPAIFVYCQNDQIIPKSNSEILISKFREGYRRKCQTLKIEENHNSTRKQQTIKQIITIIKRNVRISEKNEKKSQLLYPNQLTLTIPVNNKIGTQRQSTEQSTEEQINYPSKRLTKSLSKPINYKNSIILKNEQIQKIQSTKNCNTLKKKASIYCSLSNKLAQKEILLVNPQNIFKKSKRENAQIASSLRNWKSREKN